MKEWNACQKLSSTEVILRKEQRPEEPEVNLRERLEALSYRAALALPNGGPRATGGVCEVQKAGDHCCRVLAKVMGGREFTWVTLVHLS